MDLVPVASLWGVIFFRLFLDFGFLATYAFSAGLFRVSVLFFLFLIKLQHVSKIFKSTYRPPSLQKIIFF